MLSSTAKAFETLLADQIRLFFDEQMLFAQNQHGFRKSHSCETVVHQLLAGVYDNLDKKRVNCLLFVDYESV